MTKKKKSISPVHLSSSYIMEPTDFGKRATNALASFSPWSDAIILLRVYNVILFKCKTLSSLRRRSKLHYIHRFTIFSAGREDRVNLQVQPRDGIVILSVAREMVLRSVISWRRRKMNFLRNHWWYMFEIERQQHNTLYR